MSQELLTENGVGFIVRATISESVKRESDKNGLLIVKRVPCTITDEKNANGRIYSKATMEKSIAQARSKGFFEGRRLHCTGDDHPESTYPKPIHASHVCIDAYVERVDGKNILFNDWLILPTRNGQDLKAVVENSSFGTSIRGLGRQDESTGEITNYEYLGTDVVGNPSAGTFSPFSEAVTECVVESVSETYAKTVIESVNLNSQEGTNEMFVLSEAIDQFNAKYELSEGVEIKHTSEMISDILAIEKQVNFESEDDVKMLENFKSDILGEAPKVEEKAPAASAKAENAKDADLLNKFERQVEQGKVIAEHLKTQNESLLTQVESLSKYKESSNKLVASLVKKAEDATKKLESELSSIEEDKQALVDQMKEAAIKIVEDLQAEAKEVIQNTEDQLEAAIQFGNLIAEHFFAQQAINESLVERMKASGETEVTEEEVKTKEAIGESVVAKSRWKLQK